jgi:hypothetical protein
MKKRYPAFGKVLMEQRMGGKIPSNSVCITFDWDIGRIFPCIKIDGDKPFDNLEFRYLAGLDVIIAYKDKHADKILSLVKQILEVNPRMLQAFAIDIPTTLIIKHSDGRLML